MKLSELEGKTIKSINRKNFDTVSIYFTDNTCLVIYSTSDDVVTNYASENGQWLFLDE